VYDEYIDFVTCVMSTLTVKRCRHDDDDDDDEEEEGVDDDQG